jgi:hypothetical protein
MYSILLPYLHFALCKKKVKRIVQRQICVYLNYEKQICTFDNQRCPALDEFNERKELL